ncbi:transposable element Tcb2 transposase [Trichonephila clavipes]|uniref:Transposable element Tcb2 transposase n=1 Tax=Trichonephila clavipes TaxID=2585209 RepID=A0A8X6V3I9_TRICX|nr:transposable element Tcb2 transposase [Trichonephila clavipes]
MGFESSRPTRVPLFNARHRTARLAWHSLGSLVGVSTSLNAIWYVELLGDHLHPFMLFCYPNGNRVFQQDNCSSQKSRLATGWLDEHSSYFSVINWPLEAQT